jgi:deoxyribodipyrimidine photo-lyase
MAEKAIFWFRRDLRIHDNQGLCFALEQFKEVIPVFIFDSTILDSLSDRADKRVNFIHRAITALNRQLQEKGSGIITQYGDPKLLIPALAAKHGVKAIVTCTDYEPYARRRDALIEEQCHKAGIAFHSIKDQVIFEKNEVVKDDGNPYTIFTPYMKKWKQRWQNHPPDIRKPAFNHLSKSLMSEIVSLQTMHFESVKTIFPEGIVSDEILRHYAERRDFPAMNATSKLSVHLRFGTISIRDLALKASSISESWWNELIWREFYMMILWHFPHVAGQSFKPAYDRIEWRNNETEFQSWCEGKTGYPIVDAGMRELVNTGFMHNRVRMITASFLTKHLLIDWRWGEAFFARYLLDFDLSANNGGWQWAASSGCDAAPYFRIFNPYEQQKKFDPNMVYIRKWVPEIFTPSYPKPIVDHKMARERVLSVYRKALND